MAHHILHNVEKKVNKTRHWQMITRTILDAQISQIQRRVILVPIEILAPAVTHRIVSVTVADRATGMPLHCTNATYSAVGDASAPWTGTDRCSTWGY